MSDEPETWVSQLLAHFSCASCETKINSKSGSATFFHCFAYHNASSLLGSKLHGGRTKSSYAKTRNSKRKLAVSLVHGFSSTPSPAMPLEFPWRESKDLTVKQ